MTIATLKTEIKDLKNALNTPLDEKLKAKLREQLSKSEKTLAEMESAKTPTAKKNATKKANVVAKKSTSVLQKIKKANKKVEPKKATPKKAIATKKTSVLQQLKSKIKLTKNLSGYKKSGIDLVRDADRPALPAGRRISKDGNVYYENRLNRVDIKQPPKRYPKLEDGGMMADGGEISKIKMYYHKTSGGAEYLCSEKVEGTKEGSMKAKYVCRIDGAKNGSEMIIKPTYSNYINVPMYYHKTSGGAEYLCSEKVEGTNEGSMKSKYVCRIDGAKNGSEMMARIWERVKVGNPKRKMADGGMMAKDFKVGDNVIYTDATNGKWYGRNNVSNIKEGVISNIQEISNTKLYTINRYNQFGVLIDTYDTSDLKRIEMNTDLMAKGGRLKSAIMRDRAYKSNEPHEQAYTRKSRPKNPKYNYGFFADGGETEMHRAYAMGGVLQHGLEMGDFIISHDEGKMVVMNGGSKYEVNIHSGSRTKID